MKTRLSGSLSQILTTRRGKKEQIFMAQTLLKTPETSLDSGLQLLVHHFAGSFF
jgi:hypothetical protein